MGTRVTAAKVAALRENLTAILGELESGRVESSEVERARYEGAITALDALRGDSSTILGRLRDPTP